MIATKSPVLQMLNEKIDVHYASGSIKIIKPYRIITYVIFFYNILAKIISIIF